MLFWLNFLSLTYNHSFSLQKKKKKVLFGLSKKSLSHVTVWIHLLQLKKVKLILIKLLKIKLPTVLQLFIKWSKKNIYILISKLRVCLVTVFFPLFSVSKNNFLFLKLKNLFGNQKWIENKNYSQNSICEGNWKHAKCCFQFLIFKSQWKYALNLINLSHLMS